MLIMKKYKNKNSKVKNINEIKQRLTDIVSI